MLWLQTAGESHGPNLTAILGGVPSGLPVDREHIDRQLARRQAGYGRSPRQKIETDKVIIEAGLRHGKTMGSPIALRLLNRDHQSAWQHAMNPWPTDELQGNWRDNPITVVRPGHADFGGIARGGFEQDGLRPVLERSSARETAIRVAAGAVCQQLLAQLGVDIRAHVIAVGSAHYEPGAVAETDSRWRELDDSEVRCLDETASTEMIAQIDVAKKHKDTLGGMVEIVVYGLPPGIGGYVTNAERIDGRIARAMLSVHAMKSVTIGAAESTTTQRGSEAHDEIFPCADDDPSSHGMGVTRKSNRAGGIEGGMTNGAPLVVRVGMKPLPTLMRPLQTVDLSTGETHTAHAERSDTCAISAAAIALEAAMAVELATVLREMFGTQSQHDFETAFHSYRERVRYPKRGAVTLS